MPRTIINLADEDKAWLDRRAKADKLPMTELVRRAIQLYRGQQESRGRPDLRKTLERTAGIWRDGNGLEYQRRLRSEWERSP